MADRANIEDSIREIIEEVLGLDPEEVTPAARFEQDLGGESIDILELSFQCEKRFGVKTQFEKMFAAEEIKTDERGCLTPETLVTMKEKFPFLDTTEFEREPRKDRLMDLLTVRAITEYVRFRVDTVASAPRGQRESPEIEQ